MTSSCKCPIVENKRHFYSKHSPSPLHHTFLLGRARFTAQPLSTLLQTFFFSLLARCQALSTHARPDIGCFAVSIFTFLLSRVDLLISFIVHGRKATGKWVKRAFPCEREYDLTPFSVLSAVLWKDSEKIVSAPNFDNSVASNTTNVSSRFAYFYSFFSHAENSTESHFV